MSDYVSIWKDKEITDMFRNYQNILNEKFNVDCEGHKSYAIDKIKEDYPCLKSYLDKNKDAVYIEKASSILEDELVYSLYLHKKFYEYIKIKYPFRFI